MNGWKITAIIFIVLFMLETGFLIYSIKIGNDLIRDENKCAYDICGLYDTYYFDDYDNVCYCFVGDEIQHIELIK